MSYKELVLSDYWNVYGNSITGGLCEKYVENAYNKYGQFSSAYDSWNLEKANGTTYTGYPPNIECPIWFGSSWNNDLGRYGHIAIHLGDGRVASSSLSGTYAHPYIHNSIDDLINFYGQGIYYLGYSQWFCGIKLWEKIDDNKIKSGYRLMSNPRNGAIYAKDTATCTQCVDKDYKIKFIVSNRAGRNGDYLAMVKPRNGAKFTKAFSVNNDGSIQYCVDENDQLKFIYKNGVDFKR
ncbi:MAG: hypothetical protein LBT91_02730 [Bifidobacteriaceae bacterium]|jgi:hypothetical protein|nr:hypothetical protein [Bifidobacteriaceae bacterium]